MATTAKKCHDEGGGVVSKTVDTKMLQTVINIMTFHVAR